MKSIRLLLVLAVFYSFFSVTLAHAQSAAHYYELALSAFNREKISEAYIQLKNALQQEPEHLPSKLLMGKVLFIDGFLDDAITEFEEVLANGADINLVAEPLAQSYMLARRYDEVVALRQRQGLSQDRKIALDILAAQANVKRGQPDKAEEIIAALNAKFGNTPEVMIATAQHYLNRQEMGMVGELLSGLAAQGISTAPVSIIRANWLSATGKPIQAIEELTGALARYNEHPTMMRDLVTLYSNAGENEKALLWANKIETQTPGDLMNKVIKARLLILLGKEAEAIPLLTSLSNQFSLLTDEATASRTELALPAGITAFLLEKYDTAESELTRYLNEKGATPSLITMLVQSMRQRDKGREALKIIDKYSDVVAQSEESVVLACELYVQNNRAFKCEELLRQAQTRFPDAIGLHLSRATLLASTDKQKALTYAQQHLANTTNLNTVSFFALLHGELGQYDEALLQLDKLSAPERQQSPLQNVYVDLLLRVGRVDDANEQNQLRLQQVPQDVAALINDARILFERGDDASALSQLKKSLSIDRGLNQARLLAAQIHSQRNKPNEGIALLLEAKTLNAKAEDVRQLLVALYLQNNEPEKALAEIDQLLKLDRFNVAYREKRIEIHLILGNKKQALDDIKTLVPMVGESPTALLQVAELQSKAGDTDSALATIENVLAKFPKLATAHLMYANLLMQAGRPDDAYKFVTSSLKALPASFELQLVLAQILFDKAEYSSSFDTLTRVMRDNDELISAQVLLYRLSEQNEVAERALERLQELAERNPSNFFVVHLAADAQMRAGKQDAALEKYKRLVKEDDLPRKEWVLNNLALLTSTRNLSEAITYAESALSIDPNSAAINDTLGWLYAQASDYSKSLEYLRRASVMNASDPAIQFHLAYVLTKLGRASEARAIMLQHKPHTKEFIDADVAKILFDSLN